MKINVLAWNKIRTTVGIELGTLEPTGFAADQLTWLTGGSQLTVQGRLMSSMKTCSLFPSGAPYTYPVRAAVTSE